MADDKILVELEVDNKKANSAIDETSSKTNKLGDILKEVGKIGAAAFAGMSAFVAKSISEYGKSEAAINKLNQAMANQGIFSASLSKSYQEMATSLQKVTTFADEDIVAAQATIQTYLGQTRVTEDLTRSVLDLAQAKGMDLASAAEMVGKAIRGDTDNLGRNKVALVGVAETSERASIVVQKLQKDFGGQAEAAAKGTGSLQTMDNLIGDLYESFGMQFLPALRLVKGELVKVLDTFEASPQIIQSYRGALENVVIVAMVLKNIIIGLGEVIGSTLARSFEVVSNVINGNFKQALENVKGAAGDIGGIVKESIKNSMGDIETVRAEFAKSEEQLAAQTAEANNKAFQEDEVVKQNKLDKEIDYYNNLFLTTLAGEEKIRLMSKGQKDQTVKDQQAFFATTATLANAKNKELAAIGKAAGILQVAIATPPAIAGALRFGNVLGGPVLGAVFAGITSIAMGAQAAAIAGVKLARGGYASGGSVSSGLSSVDNVPALLQRGEFVAPKESANDIIDARARELAGQSNNNQIEVQLSFKDNIGEFIDATILRRRSVGVGAL
jgi:hypothetical protein